MSRQAMASLARSLARWPAVVAASALAALTLVLFHSEVFQGRVFFDRDIHLFWYTQVESFVRIVTTPAWPLWDPYTSFGQPLLADPSAQILYPTTWLNLLMRPWVYYTLLVVSHVWLSGCGVVRLSRALGLSRGAGFIAAGAWITSGPLLSLINVTHHFTGACWMPWVLVAVERARRDPGPRSAAWWALAQSLQVFAGSADMCALTVVASALLLARSLHPRLLRSLRSQGRLLACGLTAIGLTLALTAVLWGPALAVAARSARHALPQFDRTYWSVHPLSLLELVLPLSERTVPFSPLLGSILYEGREPFLYSMYLGLPVVPLVIAGFRTRERALLRALVAGFAIALLTALGRHSPFYGVLVTLVPPLQIFRYPQKAMALVALTTALLAGLGYETWRSRDELGRRWGRLAAALPWLLVLTGWAAVALLVWQPERVGVWLIGSALPAEAYAAVLSRVAGRLALSCTLGSVAALAASLRRWNTSASATLAALAGGCALLDLVCQNGVLHPTTVRDFYRYRPPILESIQQTNHSRLYVYDYVYSPPRARRYLGPTRPYAVTRGPRGWSYPELQWLAYREALVPPIAGAWGRESSFDADFRGLYPRFLVELVQGLLDSEGSPAHLRLLRIGGVSEVLALHRQGLEALEPVATLPSLTALPLRLYHVPRPLPRCFVVDGVRLSEERDALATLEAPSFDPEQEVLLHDGAARAHSPGFSGACQVVALRPDEVHLEVTSSSPAHVVLIDLFDPGWRAAVDGAPATLLRANMAFRAVLVPAGAHEVTLTYRPRSLVWGGTLSLGALFATAALLIGRRPPLRASGNDVQR